MRNIPPLYAPGTISVCALLAVLLVLPGCVVPNHMNVTDGVAPGNIDKNVRFRTTYYFRTFDYCWRQDPADTTNSGKKYSQIVPQTDTIYRYVMTGQASALANRVRFEAGTLDKDEIDPFSKPVAIAEDKGSSGNPPQAVAAAAGPAAAGQCTDYERQKGFMLMGPEGMIPFDQNKRLILAMHSSADPLIDTLQEYANRVRNARHNTAEQLLPLVQENARSVDAQRALDRIAAADSQGQTPQTIADAAIAAFGADKGGAK